ncbi:MAG: sulfite exporter TauE/SafE family protein [Myxococcales bacterium]|nr:sulfite exporter TauE/SafE family protein [Myxococcales bacterium]
MTGLTVAFAVAALLFASVGHAGASAYLVAMALAGVDPTVMKPTALILNLVVGTIALVQFARAGRFSWRLFWPFALGSAPFALIGGALAVHATVFRALVAVALVAAALRLAMPTRVDAAAPARPLPVPIAVAIGAAIGLLAGITGTGGGIYLSPVLIFFRWADGRDTGGVAAAFILVNSIAGLLGNRPDLSALPAELPVWAVVVAASGFCGAWVGSRYATPLVFKRLIAAVLLVAVVKLLAT